MVVTQAVVQLGAQKFLKPLLPHTQQIQQTEDPILLLCKQIGFRKLLPEEFHHPLALSPTGTALGLHQHNGGEIAQEQALCLHLHIGFAGAILRELVILAHQPPQNSIGMSQSLQLIPIGYALLHITDAVVVDKQIHRRDASGMTAREGGKFVILIEHMLRKPDAEKKKKSSIWTVSA